MQHLAGLKNLRTLQLGGTAIGDGGLVRDQDAADDGFDDQPDALVVSESRAVTP